MAVGWQELFHRFVPDGEADVQGVIDALGDALREVSAIRAGRPVFFYGSAFLQQSHKSNDQLSITYDDINGFMNAMYGAPTDNGLTLVLHTPGGSPDAADSIVGYLRSKFDYIEVIVPTFAMSAGTMVSLASDLILMGRQSQLGPIDPQMMTRHGVVSAHTVVDLFQQAQKDILGDQAQASIWMPILSTHGPSLLGEARRALAYADDLASRWLEKWMLAGNPDPAGAASAIAEDLGNANKHGSHGRRIDRDAAQSLGLRVESLEDSQALQDAVMVAYHLACILFEAGSVLKMIMSSTGRSRFSTD